MAAVRAVAQGDSQCHRPRLNPSRYVHVQYAHVQYVQFIEFITLIPFPSLPLLLYPYPPLFPLFLLYQPLPSHPLLSLPADRAPSVLNGGLTNEWIIGTGVFSLVLGAVLELKGMEMVRIISHRQHSPLYCTITVSLLYNPVDYSITLLKSELNARILFP